MNLSTQQMLHDFVEERDHEEEIEFAIGYGSGVMEHGNHENQPGLDLIFVVRNALRFHTLNLEKFPKDYSLLKYLGSPSITALQRTGGAISYNLLTHMERRLKYGIISKEDFIKDLEEWNLLYTAGRVHKPYYTIKSPSADIAPFLKENLHYAFRMAVLLLAKDELTHKEIFEKITALSYMGDPRPEDPKKIKNIVSKNLDAFHALYKEVLTEEVPDIQDNSHIILPENHRKTFHEKIPQRIKAHLPKLSPQITPEVFESIIQTIVRRPAFIQILKGAITSNPAESIPYACKKIKKAFQSKS